MTLLQNNVATQLAFSMHENKGVYALLLGSGVSRAAEIPTGWDITLDLIRKAGLAEGAEEAPDWEAWYIAKYGQAPSYSQLLDGLTTTASERRKMLESYIEPTIEEKEEGKKLPTAAHHAIAKLVSDGFVKVIITTNFDRLMENALRDAGVEPTVITSEDSLQGAEPLTHSSCYLVKLHGDYKDARILNTDDELETYPDSYNDLLDRIFDEFGLVICGWSGYWDVALTNAIARVKNRRYPTYWAARGELTGKALQIANQKGAKLVSIFGANEFFVNLQRIVETVEQSGKQNPINLGLLINSTKRYVASSDQRVLLDDLFSREQQRLLTALSSDVFDYQKALDSEGLALRITQYEALSESLACMSGVLGHWGDENVLRVIVDLVESITKQMENLNGGRTQLTNLGTYPAVLIVSAFCLGLVKARKWKELQKFLLHDLKSNRHAHSSTIFKLYPGAWNGNVKDMWNQLPKYSQSPKKIPFSGHLLEVMHDWSPHFVGTDPDFPLLFARFELTAAFINFQREDIVRLEASLTAGEQMGWLPLCHALYIHELSDSLIAEFSSDSFVQELEVAGLLTGGRRIMELFLECLKDAQQRSYW